MSDWQKIEAPHDPEAGSGIPLWRQRINREGWLIMSGTGAIVYIPDSPLWSPTIIKEESK